YNGIDSPCLQRLPQALASDARTFPPRRSARSPRLACAPQGTRMKAMLLAAGRGERMGALTADMPKPLLEVGDKTLIERHVARLAEGGIVDLVVNLSYRGARIREALGDGSRYGVRIAYSDEGEPPLETAGGIIHALRLLGPEPFLLVNA